MTLSSATDSLEAIDRPSPTTGANGPDAAEKRLQRLAESVRGLGRTRRGITLDRWLLIGGGVLLPLGIVLVLLGWYGAAHTGRLFEQIPYLISGGLLGLALVVAGGVCCFGCWVTRPVCGGRPPAAGLRVALRDLAARPPGGAAGHAG